MEFEMGKKKKNEKKAGNVIVGEKAIIWLFHTPDKNEVLNEVVKHPSFSADFLNFFKRASENELSSVSGWGYHCDHRKHGQGKRKVWSYGKQKSGGPRIYLTVSSYGDKPLYVVFLVGDKNSQKQSDEYDRIYNRWDMLDALMKKNLVDIEKEISDALPKDENENESLKNNNHVETSVDKACSKTQQDKVYVGRPMQGVTFISHHHLNAVLQNGNEDKQRDE